MTEAADVLTGVRAEAGDELGRDLVALLEIAFDAVECGRRGGLEEDGLELEPVCPLDDDALAYLRERFLSHRLWPSYEEILDACCAAWNRLRAEPGRSRSLCSFGWLPPVTT